MTLQQKINNLYLKFKKGEDINFEIQNLKNSHNFLMKDGTINRLYCASTALNISEEWFPTLDKLDPNNTFLLQEALAYRIQNLNLLISGILWVEIPLIFVSLNREFVNQFKKLLTGLYFDKNEFISYVIIPERSDTHICLTVYCNMILSQDHELGRQKQFYKMVTEDGYFLDGVDEHVKANEARSRFGFWKHLNLNVILEPRINVVSLNREIARLNIPEWDVYLCNYHVQQRTNSTLSLQSNEKAIMLYNKWLCMFSLLFGFEHRERLYAHEDIAYIASIYRGLGFTEMRLAENYLLDLSTLEDVADYLLDEKFWPYFTKTEYSLSRYMHIRNTNDTDKIDLVENKHAEAYYYYAKKNNDIYWMMQANTLVDPTVHILPAHRGPVTRDFFTTSRRFSHYDYENGIYLDTTDEEIEELSDSRGVILTKDKSKDLYHDFRQRSKKQLLIKPHQ